MSVVLALEGLECMYSIVEAARVSAQSFCKFTGIVNVFIYLIL